MDADSSMNSGGRCIYFEKMGYLNIKFPFFFIGY